MKASKVRSSLPNSGGGETETTVGKQWQENDIYGIGGKLPCLRVAFTVVSWGGDNTGGCRTAWEGGGKG